MSYPQDGRLLRLMLGDAPDDQMVPARLFVATEALAAGSVTRRELPRRYTKVYRNVYASDGDELTALDRAQAAWLWSGRRATLVGHSAAALLGSRWIPPDAPVEIAHARRPAARGITVRSDLFRDDELCIVGCISCTRPARTAYDLGRRLPVDSGVIRVDALLNATKVTVAAVESVAQRHPGARGIRQLRSMLTLVDPGAESPQETRVRLLLVRDGMPPVTQIKVGNRRIDMGYPLWKVGVEYDGEQHWTDPDEYAKDIERLESLASQGWIIVRVSATQLRYQSRLVVKRVRDA